MTSARPLVVLGGTFDPPHVGHLVLAECARVQFGARAVLFLVAGDPYRKSGSQPGRRQPGQEGRIVSPAEHRLAMTRLATADNPAFVVDDREVRRDGPTYTVDSLEELRAEGEEDVVLLLGSDAVADMPNWKAPERIRELARLGVVPKGGLPVPADAGPVTRVDMPNLPVSSTLIRGRVAEGLPVRYLVPPTVDDYIREHGLYRDNERGEASSTLRA